MATTNNEQRPPEWFSIEDLAAQGKLSDRDFDRIRRHLHRLEAQNKSIKTAKLRLEKVTEATKNYGLAMLKRMGLPGMAVVVVVREE